MADPITLRPHQTPVSVLLDLHAPTGSGKSVIGPLLEEHIYTRLEPVISRSTYNLILDRDIGAPPESEIVTDVPLDLLTSEEVYALLMKGPK